jgi:hypothetical protein
MVMTLGMGILAGQGYLRQGQYGRPSGWLTILFRIASISRTMILEAADLLYHRVNLMALWRRIHTWDTMVFFLLGT